MPHLGLPVPLFLARAVGILLELLRTKLKRLGIWTRQAEVDLE
jgi:hypothetical protein